MEYESIKEKPLKAGVKISDFLDSINVTFQYQIDKIFSKDGRFIDNRDRFLISEKIKNTSHKKILITHSNITMIETARFLGRLNVDKTIVLVGSFVSGSTKNTDASFNLGYAICALRQLNKGVFIAMNGNILNWTEVFKNIKTNRFEPDMD